MTIDVNQRVQAIPEGQAMKSSIPRLPSALCRYGVWSERQTVIAGPAAATALADEVDRLGAKRVYLFTTASLVREEGLLAQIKSSLGAGLVGEFSACRPHTPRTVVLEAAQAVREANPDLIVSFGGSTVSDTAKGVSMAISNGLTKVGDFDDVDPVKNATEGTLVAPLIPKIAIPTTLSGAEYSAFVGITNEATQVKRVYHQPGLAPAAVLLDVAVTEATPQQLWCSTGVKCLSDSIELLCSPSSHPFVQIITRSAVELFAAHLPGSVSDDEAVRDPARAYCQHATWMSAFSLANSTSKLGIGTSVRHQLGAMGVAHGEATCVMLPHLLAYNWPALGDVRGDIASALGLTRGGDLVSDKDVSARLSEFVASLGLPYRLRDVGVGVEDIQAWRLA